MAHIVEICNPFEPFKDTRAHVIEGGISLKDWLRGNYPGFIKFDRPTLCLVNGSPKLQAEWETYIIRKDDIVNFITQPGYAFIPILFYYILAASVIYSIYTLATMPKPQIPGQTPEADPTYDLKGQTNQIRLGSPIEVPYGRCILWPSYAARPYNKFANNDQYQYSLYCLGQGRFKIHGVKIEDTPIDNFQDIIYRVYEPGEQVALFPDNVVSSIEVGSIELFGPNEPDFEIAGPYASNPANTLSNHLEVDVVFPQGLYVSKNDGTLDYQTITASFEYREIDNTGAPIGSWQSLSNFTKTLKTNTPQRFTLEANVNPGRYEVRAQRTNNKNTDVKAVNVINWVALRSFLPSTKDYGNVTLLAMRARASNNLNDRAAARLNVDATRLLPTRVDGQWTEETETRSLVWAFCDLFKSPYGGRLTDNFLDIVDLEAADAYYTEKGIFFDFVFDQRSTVWECAKAIARVGRAVPMLNGSRITLVREQPKTLPSAIFNPDCIVQGSFVWEIKLAGLDDYDGVEIEYTNPTTWKPETVKCLVGDDQGNYCEPIKLPGCTDRTVAWREGMYIRATRIYIRENIKFKTGLEGHLPSYGDLIGVNHDLPRWSQGGIIVEIVGTTVTLSEPVSFEGAGPFVIGLRNKQGGLSGPHVVTAGANANQVILDEEIEDEFFFDDVHERPMYLFGQATDWAKNCVVVKLSPSDDDTVEVQSVGYDERCFAADELFPPDDAGGTVPSRPPDLPVVNRLSVAPVANTPLRAMASWDTALGAKSYVVQLSYDNVNWEYLGNRTENYLEFSILQSFIYVRVAGINTAQGPWYSWSGDIEPASPGGPGSGSETVIGGDLYTDI